MRSTSAVIARGVWARGDLLHRRGRQPERVPHVVGYAASGTIVAAGANVTDRAIGQRVATFDFAGSHAALRVVVDPVGATIAVSQAALRPEGRLVFVGNAADKAFSIDLWPAMFANQTLMGVYLGVLFTRPEVSATIDAMLADVAAGHLVVPIAKRFPLAEAAEAHLFAEEGAPLGRVIMVP